MVRPCAVIDCDKPILKGSPYCEEHTTEEDKKAIKLNDIDTWKGELNETYGKIEEFITWLNTYPILPAPIDRQHVIKKITKMFPNCLPSIPSCAQTVEKKGGRE